MTQGTPSQGFTELIGRALTDQKFRQELFRDQAGVAARYNLSPSDREALGNLSQETLNEHADQFAKGNATALTISVVIRIKF